MSTHQGENVSEIQSLKAEIQRLKSTVRRWNNWNMLFITIAAVSAA